MTLIDKISFQFKMADEQFAKELYADWDGFCQRCVTDVLEEYFSGYDNKDTYIEIDLLDLDLGDIPQEDFYNLFPVRLREALERNFISHLNGIDAAHPLPEEIGTGQEPLPVRGRRLDNLLHYLEYGFCLPEWYGQDFDLYEELLHFGEKTDMEKLLPFLSGRPHALERLFLQAGDSALLSVWLSSSTPGQYEKQRYLAAVLERVPQAVIRFIHETRDIGSIEGMAELLESPHAKCIMAAETENHAEIDVPEYWHRLYGWLLEYYPFNGVPMFGDKRHFQLHLNQRLLSFIRKRDYQAYLSKAELTVQFLLEVFGADYYLTVLDIIYHNQRLNADGSPATGDSYAWELYYMLLQLSLLKIGQGKTENADGQSVDGKEDEISPYSGALFALRRSIGSFGKWLENTELPDSAKRKYLLRLAEEKPELLVQWLKERPEKRYVSLLAALIDESSVLLLTGQISLQLTEAVSAVSDMLNRVSTSVSWLKGIGNDLLTVTLNSAVLEGIGAEMFQASDSVSMQIVRITGLLYKEITGRDVLFAAAPSVTVTSNNGIDIPAALWKFIGAVAKGTSLLTVDNGKILESQIQRFLPAEKSSDMQQFSVLYTVLSKGDISEKAKRMLVLQWFDTYHDKESELIIALQSKKLLEKVIDLLDNKVLRHIVMQLAGHAFGTSGMNTGIFAVQLIGLLVENIRAVAVLVSRPAKELWQVLFVSLASGSSDSVTVAAANSVEFAMRLLSAIAGNDRVQVVIGLFIRQLSHTHFFIGNFEGKVVDERDFISGFGNGALLALLIRIQEYICSGRQDGHVLKSTYGETDIFGKPDEETFDDLVAWLMSPSVSDTAKSQMLRHYARWQPKLLWSLVRHSADGAIKKTVPFRQWSVWLGKEVWMEMISGVSLSLGETLRQITGIISDKYEVSESVLSEGLARFIAGYPAGQISYGDNPAIVRRYISTLAPLAWEGGIPTSVQKVVITDGSQSDHRAADKISPLDNFIKEVEAQVHIADTEQLLEKAVQPEYIEVPNAGLCLLAIWFSRLFGMLGLLTEDKKDLKDTKARIRAIFILQRLVTDEPREYKEQELAFNRILTGCPFYVPLPKTLKLTVNEMQSIESMIVGVKDNWDKLRNTSVKGFQRSFIERPGRLEQREEKWVLYVEGRSYDILLDSLPWSYRLIRLPWLKKRINVVWRDKEEFNY